MKEMGAGIGKTMEKMKEEKENRDKKEREEQEKRIYNKEKYIEERRNSGSDKDLKSELLGGIRFPEGTVSYIGARTGRGKTTSLVNIAREILTGEEKRKVIFITLEMSCGQILNKLILCSTYAMSKSNREEIRLLKCIKNPARELDKIIQKKDEEKKEEYRYFKNNIMKAMKKAFEWMDKKELIIYDGRGAKEEEIMDFIKEKGEAGTAVLIDYTQKIPAKEGTDKESFRRVQAISYDLLETAGKTRTIIIAAAQFVRSGNKGTQFVKGVDSKKDSFSEESFRECGDIEQDAHNAIGVGWENNKKERFIEILKTREDEKQGEEYKVEFNGSYSYMATGRNKSEEIIAI